MRLPGSGHRPNSGAVTQSYEDIASALYDIHVNPVEDDGSDERSHGHVDPILLDADDGYLRLPA